MKTCRICSIVLSLTGASVLVLAEFFTPVSSRAALLVFPVMLLVALVGLAGASRAILTPRTGAVMQLSAGVCGLLLIVYLSLLYPTFTTPDEQNSYLYALVGAFMLAASGGFSLLNWNREYQV